MEFSENLAYMYGQISKFSRQTFGLQQALAPNDNFCSDRPSGLKKTKFV
jgi:hypothetical protein